MIIKNVFATLNYLVKVDRLFILYFITVAKRRTARGEHKRN